MSSPSEIAEVAADGVADGMHIVGEEALAAEKVVRGFQAVNLGYFGLGLAAGAAAGAFVAWKVAFSRAEAKYSKIAADEVAEMREHFNAKEIARENIDEKGDLETIIKDKGYSYAAEPSEPPMAVTPPLTVVEAAEEAQEDIAEVPPPAEEDPVPEIRWNVFRDNEPPEDDWDWHKEKSRRSPLKPYVIHIDEREGNTAYEAVTYTYYEEDDVVCNEHDDVIGPEEREQIFGEENLTKFGHGSNDRTTVYVRNDQLEMDIEIIQSPNSYAEEVHGFDPSPPEIMHSDKRRGRIVFDDD